MSQHRNRRESPERERERERERGRAGGVSKFPNNIRPLRSDELLSIVSVNRPNFSRSSLTAMTRKKLFSPSLSLSLSLVSGLFSLSLLLRAIVVINHRISPTRAFVLFLMRHFLFLSLPPPHFVSFVSVYFRFKRIFPFLGNFQFGKCQKSHTCQKRGRIFSCNIESKSGISLIFDDHTQRRSNQLSVIRFRILSRIARHISKLLCTHKNRVQ